MQKNLSLNCKEFENYLVDTHDDIVNNNIGIHYIFRFPNGYGASVVKMYGSYGYENDKWEVVTILFENETDRLYLSDYILVYPKSITSRRDALGNLTDNEVIDILKKIKELGE